MRKRSLVVAAAVLVGSTFVRVDSAAAVDQTFGTAQGSNWVIGSYARDGVTAAVPYPAYSAGGSSVLYAQRSNAGNIARIAVGFSASPCTRALGTAGGTTWGDTSCSAV